MAAAEAHLPVSRRFKRVLRGQQMRTTFLMDRTFFGGEALGFRCNICGRETVASVAVIKLREAPSCPQCKSTLRFRSIAAALSRAVFGEIRPLYELPLSRHLVGIGMSDSDVYAGALSRIFSYQNTFYHTEPRLDITDIEETRCGTADLIVSSDVFEHVPPPIGPAFENMFRLLKSGGVCVFSAPYENEGETREYYPELYRYEITGRKGREVLINTTREGQTQRFENLEFHGGPGSTLTMRVFTRPSLQRHFEQAGFTGIVFHDESVPGFGVLTKDKEDSLIVTAHKP